MAGKRKAEYALFDCHACEPEVDETTVEASQKAQKEDDDDDIISDEEYAAIMAESHARAEEKCRQMFARLGLRRRDYDEEEDEDEEDEEEEEEEEEVLDDDESDGDMEESALGSSN